MSFKTSLKLAINNLKQKRRTSLTVFGALICISEIIIMNGLGIGIQNKVKKS